MRNKWSYDFKADELDVLKNDVELSGLTETQLKVLYNRGVKTRKDILDFLYNGLNHLHDTRLMADAEKAVDLIIYHIKAGHTIVFHSDYDSDGGHGGALGVLGLKDAGAKSVFVYANNRFTQGYGILVSSVDEILKLYPDVKLIVTVDNGILAFEAIDYARSKGIDVIVTDHHEPNSDGTLPNANAVVDPHRLDCNYPCKYLCGTGVIFKVMMLLYHKMNLKVTDTYKLLDLVAMATVGDVVPILGENRILVREGIKRIKNGDRYVFRAFQEVTQVQDINAHFTIGFVYVPMINAIGRLEGSVDEIFKMYLSNDEDEIKEIVLKLKQLNDTRKEMTVIQYGQAEEIVFNKYISKFVNAPQPTVEGKIDYEALNYLNINSLPKSLIVYSSDFDEGLVGLVAGRLKEKYNRPVVVFTDSLSGLKGSARGVNNFHVKEAFDAVSSSIVKYGGHGKAGGLTVLSEKIDEFEYRFNEQVNLSLKDEDLIKKYNIDNVFTIETLDIHLIDELKELEPFGEGFRNPILAINAEINKPPFYMGANKQHVKLLTETKKKSIIMWNEAEKIKKHQERKKSNDMVIKALGHPSINVYQNEINIQFVVDSENYVLY